MKITKFGHTCLLVEEGGLRLLIDPGSYSSGFEKLKNLDVLLITHEHQDHINIDAVKKLIENDPGMQILTVPGAGKILEKEHIPFTQRGGGEIVTVKNVPLEFFGKLHAVIHSSLPVCDNIGVMIANRFFFPGDALTIPPKPVEILALPVGGPWIKLGETIDYAIALKPKICFPVHDGMFSANGTGTAHRIPKMVLQPLGIKFLPLEASGNVAEF